MGTDILAKKSRLDLLDVKPDETDSVVCLVDIAEFGVGELEGLAEDTEMELDHNPDYASEGDNGVFNRKFREDWW